MNCQKGEVVDVDRDDKSASPQRIELSSGEEEEKKTLQKSSDTLRRLIAEEKTYKLVLTLLSFISKERLASK